MECKHCGKEIYGGKGDYWHVRWGNMNCEDGENIASPSIWVEAAPVGPYIGQVYYSEMPDGTKIRFIYGGEEYGWMEVLKPACECCGRPF